MKTCDDARLRGIDIPCCPVCHDSLPDALQHDGEWWHVCCHVASELKKEKR